MRTLDQCKAEIDYCKEWAKGHFSVELNPMRLDEQLAELIGEKITNYFHQRFRDWTVPDLLLLRQALQPEIQEIREFEGKPLKRSIKKQLEEKLATAPNDQTK